MFDRVSSGRAMRLTYMGLVCISAMAQEGLDDDNTGEDAAGNVTPRGASEEESGSMALST